MLPAIVQLGGVPVVTDDGNIAYQFQVRKKTRNFDDSNNVQKVLSNKLLLDYSFFQKCRKPILPCNLIYKYSFLFFVVY